MDELDFTNFLAEQTLSPSTQERYLRTLQEFIGKHPNLDTVTSGDILKFVTRPEWESTSTKYVAVCAIKKYIRWAKGETHPALRARIKRIEPPPGRSLTMDQVEMLLESFDTSTMKGRRDLTICCLFLDTALRCSEMCNLLDSKLSVKEQCLYALVKGQKWRQKWFSRYTQSLLARWMEDRKHIVADGVKTVFVSCGGNTPGHPLTRCGLGHEVAKWGEEIGIKLGPHDLRRTFGNQTARAGASARVAMTAGTWDSESAYRRYTLQLEPKDIEPYSPVMKAMGITVTAKPL